MTARTAQRDADAAPRAAWMRAALGSAAVLAFPIVDWATQSDVRGFQLGYLIAGVGWLLLIPWRLRGLPWKLPLAAGLTARLLFLPAAPSDDVHRYLWEGRVVLAGENPYAAAPDAPALARLRDESFGRINHPNHAAIYGPTVQLVFAATAALHPHASAFKLLVLAADLLVIVLLVLWLRRTEQPVAAVLVYAACPLTLAAFAREAHLDAIMLAGLTWCGYELHRLARESGRATAMHALRAGLALGLAIGVKWVAAVLLPWLLVKLAWSRRGRMHVAAASAGVVLAVGIPLLYFAETGLWQMLGPLRYFGEHFRNLDYLQQHLLEQFSRETVRHMALGVVLILALGVAMTRTGADRAQLWLLGPVLLVAPTVHAWYATWLLPALSRRFVWAWAVLPLTMVLAYEGDYQRQLTGSWRMPDWVAEAVIGPVLAALAVHAVWLGYRRLRQRRKQPTDG